MYAPLLGHNLVRLVYLDEAGTDRGASYMCVAGVLVHGDVEWPEVDRRLVALIEKHIPPEDRLGFFFHATDIYHGSKYFDRRKPEWADAPKRHALLGEIADIIGDLRLPVVFGQYRKETLAANVDVSFPDEQFKDRIMHQAAILDCLVRADAWLARYAPSELATVIHEDGTVGKALIKFIVRHARSAEHLEADDVAGTLPGLPLQRIIDTVHFAEKPDARPLQLADLCAFILGRGLKGNPVPERATEIIFRHLQWVLGEVPIVYPATGVSTDLVGQPS